MTTFTLNGKNVSTDWPGDTPLLWVLRDYFGLTGTKFGCGIARCGACTIHVNGEAVRSCSRPLSSVEGMEVVTIEGLGRGRQHPLQKQWIKAQVPQCGYCQPGSIMQAAALLAKNPDPTDAEILKAMNPILCRCMTYDRVKAAIKEAAKEMREVGSADWPLLADTGAMVSFGAPELAGKDSSNDGRASGLWYDIDSNGITTVNITKAEIGHHVGTALAQAVAEELEVLWEDVRIRHVDSDPKWGLMLTGGSWSVNWTFDVLSRAGAAGRLALIKAGAEILKADPANCAAGKSLVKDKVSGKSVTYGEAVRQQPVSILMGEDDLKKLELKKPEEYRVAGQPVEALDIPAKTDGSARYSIDISRPGMVYGRLVTPAVRYGAKITAINDEEARKVPGYIGTVKLDDVATNFTGFAVCVADTYPAAMKAAKAAVVEWDGGPNQSVDDEALNKAAEDLVISPKNFGNWVLEGDAERALANSTRNLTARYTTSLNLHSPLEPVNAVAEFIGDVCHVWAGCQNQTTAVAMTAHALGVDESKVVVHQCFVGGGFGRRLDVEYTVVAALTARAVGKPVKVIYSREQDLQFDVPRSPTLQVMNGALDEEGRLTALTHDVVAGWPTGRLLPGFLAPAADNESKVDSFAVAGADFWYSVPNHHVRAIRHDLAQEAFPPGYLRSVGPGFTTFAVESFIDEVAALAKVDAVEFRLTMLDGKGKQAGHSPNAVEGALRLAHVLKEAAVRSDYGKKSLAKNTAMGIACTFGQERTMPTWIACVAEVTVDPGTGLFRINKLTLVADVGIAVNPGGTMAQMHGAALWGIGLATKEFGSVSKGAINRSNFNNFSPMRMEDVPEIEVHLVRSDYYPVGIGEPATTVVAPAIANAITNAAGARVRDLPITPEKVKAAIETH